MSFESMVEELKAEFQEELDRVNSETRVKLEDVIQRITSESVNLLTSGDQRHAENIKQLNSIGASLVAMEVVQFQAKVRDGFRRAAQVAVSTALAAL